MLSRSRGLFAILLFLLKYIFSLNFSSANWLRKSPSQKMKSLAVLCSKVSVGYFVGKYQFCHSCGLNWQKLGLNRQVLEESKVLITLINKK